MPPQKKKKKNNNKNAEWSLACLSRDDDPTPVFFFFSSRHTLRRLWRSSCDGRAGWRAGGRAGGRGKSLSLSREKGADLALPLKSRFLLPWRGGGGTFYYYYFLVARVVGRSVCEFLACVIGAVLAAATCEGREDGGRPFLCASSLAARSWPSAPNWRWCFAGWWRARCARGAASGPAERRPPLWAVSLGGRDGDAALPLK